jgi:diaminopimelate decarboxylase
MPSSLARITPAEIESTWDVLHQAGYLAESEKSILCHDLDRLRGRIAALQTAFPSNTLHTIAIKANPVVELLRCCVDCGVGLEAASLEEVHLALAAGCSPDKIIFDSPAKTTQEIDECLRRGIHLNVDNFSELARIEQQLALEPSTSTIGIRINPEVGVGTIQQTSVGSLGSKFGVSISRDRARLLAAFRRHPWLVGLHFHVGSQGVSVELLYEAAEKVQSLRTEIEAATNRDLKFIDIGGGLPTAYDDDVVPATPAEYADMLRQRVPEFFAGDARLITEFGRSIQAGCGTAFSRVEYVRQLDEGHQRAVIHLGADFLLRPAYRPQDWKHEFLALDQHGKLKAGMPQRISIAGPLCFAGDIVAREISIPRPEPGDWIAIRDCGAYTLGMWSRHCSRGIPLVLGYERDVVKVLRNAESPADVVKFWSRDA